jgi:hypothetical protein
MSISSDQASVPAQSKEEQNTIVRRTILSCLFLLAAGSALAPPPAAADAVKVLFIGNSYTYVNDLPMMLRHVAQLSGESRSIEPRMIGAPGATLQKHWERGEARAALQQGSWDYVVLQEQSVLPTVSPELMYQYARLFDAEAKRAQAKTILFLTWARAGNPEMQQPLNHAYLSLAREVGALVAPVGPAWQRALRERRGLPFYHQDQSHPMPAGSYAAACVFYSVLYGKPAKALPNGAFGLSSSDLEVIRQAAWEAVQEFR